MTVQQCCPQCWLVCIFPNVKGTVATVSRQKQCFTLVIITVGAMHAQGFVSNKDTDTTGERGDPIEGLLYAIFVASTDRADVASLVRHERTHVKSMGHGGGGAQWCIICHTTKSHVGGTRR
jgi:hypothetical protein